MTTYSADQFGLRKAEEVFHPKDAFIGDSNEGTEPEDNGVLDEIINEIFESRLAQGNIFAQLDKIPADDDVKSLAKEYLNKAIAEVS